MTTTCTITTTATGDKCGAPAVYTFTSARTGTVYGECKAHTPAAAVTPKARAEHPRTRSTAPFLLVRDGRVVGYAHSAGESTAKRALKLGAAIVDND